MNFLGVIYCFYDVQKLNTAESQYDDAVAVIAPATFMWVIKDV